MNAALWDAVRECVRQGGHEMPQGEVQVASGGCINRALVVGRGSARYFVKLNAPERLAMFEAEADGLHRLAQADALRVPAPIGSGRAAGQAFLVLEYIDFGPASDLRFARLGEALATLHAVQAARFGLARDNTIGSNVQLNAPAENWGEFYRERRLRVQLELAAANGHHSVVEPGERLCERLPELLAGHRPAPALLHGDLWSGNVGFDRAGRPVLFDPACYYGDRETDLAMTELFGGFPASFYSAYRDAAPLDAGYPLRRELYQLYHVLNHLNLFGSGYLRQALRLMARLLAE